MRTRNDKLEMKPDFRLLNIALDSNSKQNLKIPTLFVSIFVFSHPLRDSKTSRMSGRENNAIKPEMKIVLN